MVSLTVKKINGAPRGPFSQLFNEDKILEARAEGSDTYFKYENKEYIVDETFAEVADLIDLTDDSLPLSIETETASYTLALDDAGKIVKTNVGSANNLTVPPNSDVAFDVGIQITIVQYGAGQTTIVAGSGVTLRSAGGALKISEQYAAVSLIKLATNEWLVVGSLTA